MATTDDVRKPTNLSPAKQALLERMRKRSAPTVAPLIKPRADRDSAPLSYAQQRLWLIQQLDPESHLYNVPRALQIQGQLDVASLEKALNSIVERHEILRTTFPADESGEPSQKIAPYLQFKLPVTELRSSCTEQRQREIQQQVLGLAHRPFDLAHGPLLRAHLFRLAEDDYVLALAMHHIISDGWTGGVLFRELGDFYQAHLRGDAHPLPELPVQYADYAIWQREWMQGALLENELTFWRNHLAGAPASLQLPTDRERPEHLSYDGDSVSIALGKDLSGRLKALCRAEATTLFPALLAGLDLLLAQWSGQPDLVVGTVSANRDQTEIENLIGCFMNFLPLRAAVAAEETALDFLRRVKQSAFEGFAHQNCPFEKIIEAVRPQRSLNVNPLYNVALLVQNYPEIAFRTGLLEARLLPLEHGVAFLDLRFVAEEKAGGISLECEYNETLFEAATVEHLLRGYVSVLEQMTANPQARVSEISLPKELLQQAAAARRREQKQTIAITSTFTAEPVEASLAFWMKELGIRSEVSSAPYNQIFQQLLDPSSLVSRNHDGFNIVLLRLTDWQRFEPNASEAAAKEEIERGVRDLAGMLKTAAQRSPASFIVCVGPPEGKFAAKPGWGEFLGRVEQALATEVNSAPGVHLITSGEILEHYPVENYEDEYADKLGHIPYTPDFFTALGTMLARRIFALRSTRKKVVVLDCDNRLWDGVSGDGPDGVRVDASRRSLQEFIRKQVDGGMLLCLCSKNKEHDVEAGLARDPGMALGPEHIVAQRLGVDSTAAGLRELAEELQLDPARFVFISADSDACGEVQAKCPEILALLLPKDGAQIQGFLSNVWAFDQAAGQVGGPPLANQDRTVVRIASELRDVGSISRAMETARLERRPERGVFVAPRTPIEEMVAGVWAQVLQLDRVGIHDNFFALGGHSLRATQVVARVRQTLGAELPLRTMFEAPTVAEFAKRIAATRESGSERQAPPITRLATRETLPLSFAQQRLWFLNQLEPGNPLYNMPQMFRMRGRLDGGALGRAVNKIVERHESLRTTFALRDNQPVQVIARELRLPLPTTDLSGVPHQRQEEEALRLAKEEAQLPFNLSSGPVMRTQVLRLGAEDHVLLLTMHHIATDGWSMALVAEELAAHYSAFAEHKPSPLPGLSIQYADYAAWQRNWLQGEVLGAQLRHWKEQLAGAPPVLVLPADRPRPAQMSPRGAMQSVILPRSLVEKLTVLSRDEGVTLFMTLLAAFQTLLARYSGQEDIVVGSPIANRSFSELEPLIGFFVNTLALRGDLSGDPSFRELVARLKEVCLQAYAHQDIPFEKLVEELQPERSLSHSPIFQVMFALQNAPMRALQLPGLKLERMPMHTGTSIFDMFWFAIEVPEGFMIRAEYSTDLFDFSTIQRMLEHYQALLEAATAHPECRISQLPLLAEHERHQVLAEFNATQADFPSLCIHQLLEQSADRVPDATALVCGSDRVSYRELNQRANQIAHHLIKLGAGPEVLVGVFMERTPDLVPAIFGVLKSGAAYVPLDPSYPRERLAAILADSQAPIVLTQQSLAGQIESKNAEFVCIDSEWATIAQEPRENPTTQVRPDNLAYVLFTSGSTGRPKGVALEHHNNVTFVQWAQTVFTREELAGVLFCTSIGFDMSTFEMFITAAAGGKIILAENPLYLPTLPAKDEVTLINTVPSAIAELVRMNALPASLKTVALAGEALPDSLVEEIYRTGTVAKVYNLYGPTESGYSTWTLVPRGGRVTIGQPIANEQCYILDTNLSPLPVGVPGELYLAGGGLARGYFGQPDQTAERFVANPFSSQKNARMYKTGDLCRWLPDGNIEYLGRLDHQVKLRGFRIELDEIEAVLAKHSGVRQCLVMAREDQPGLKRLVAYLVPRDGESPAEAALASHLKQSLPDFMVPSAFVVLEQFPLTPNGKTDRKALPAPEYKKDAGESYIAPRTPTEEHVATIWAEVLHLERVSADGDFFDLGGHSLLAAQVISRLRQAFEVEIPLKAMFESPKLDVLAARIQAAKHGLEIPAIRRVSREKPLPASFAQQRLWFLDQLEPDTPAYNIPYTLKITGLVNADAIEESLNLIAQRHEALRTSFVTEAEEPLQIIHPSVRVPFRKVDLSALDASVRETEARRLIAEDANRAISLSQVPLLRTMLLRLSEDEHFLLINIHHIISDRWSMGVLSQELASLYDAVIEGRTAELPDLPLQYADYSVWQREWLRGPELEKQLGYWKDKLKDAPTVLELPTDRPRQATESFRGEVAYVSFPRELSDKLNQLSRRHGATLFMTLLAGFQGLLSRYSGQDDVVVGTAIANRNQPELENLIGFFLNTLPLRTKLSGDPSFAEIISRVKETALGAYAHQDMPFEKLVEELRPERSLSHSPLVQVFFVLQNAPVEELQLRGLRLKSVPSGLKTVKGDMYFSMHESPEGLEGRMEYSTDLFDASTAERLLGHFRVLLEAAVANPEMKLSELPLLTESERQQILVEWNATESGFPRHLCMHQLFEQQAARTPDRVAAFFSTQQITYRELNSRSNQLAQYLRKLGVGPDTLAGVYVERNLDMLVAVLGILKAGAAYVPLDPAYPKERIAFILEDANTPVLLTQQSLLASAPKSAARMICLDSDWEAISRESGENPAPLGSPGNLAYVLYTSGSTGKPKGVQIEHCSLMNFLISVQREPGLAVADRLLAVTTLSFDIAGLEIYLPLITGAEIVLASREEAADGPRLLTLMTQARPTVMQATPATWRMLIEAGWTGSPELKVLCGGEALPADLAQQLLPRCRELWNMYGPTETTIWSSVYRVTGELTNTAPVGRPMANTSMYVLDSKFQPVPAGVAGELYIGGDGLARGYFNRPELTAEKFIRDPFTAKPGTRLYRTGDLAKFLPDGNVQYLGRTDFQVKLRGFRIELGEIESALAQHSAVQQVVVTVREDKPGDKRLVAYVVLHSGQQLSMTDVRAHAKQSLPDYMVPSALVVLDSLPLTPNGKVDRKRLPAPDYGVADTGNGGRNARTPTEEIIAGIWSEVLNCDQVGAEDDFFELGGHSLLATQVMSRVRQAFKIQLPLRSMFETSTVAGLAERADAMAKQEQGVLLPPIRPVPRTKPLPVSFPQQRLWFLDQLEPGNPLYNVGHITRMYGPLNPEALEKGLNEIVRRHESLRTTFHTLNDQPLQMIAPKLELKIERVDVSQLPRREAREAEARKLATAELKRPFDLAAGPLVRPLLIKIGEEDHGLILNTHHIISDRWSLGVLSQELAALYEANLEGKPSPLPELDIQFADYAVWQREYLSGEVLDKQLAYWRQQLEGAPPVLELPTDRPRKGTEQFWGAQHRQPIPLELAKELKAFSRSQRGTFFMALLASFELLMGWLAAQDDVVIGTDLANRNQLETEKLIGFFVNLLPMRARLDREARFTEFFQQVRESSLGAMAHQDIPFDKLVEELRPERSLSHNPLVQVLFVMQNTPQIVREFGGLKLGPLGVSTSSRFDLVMFINDPESNPSTLWMYNPNLFDAGTIARMADRYELLLGQVCAGPELSLGELFATLDEAEKQQRGSEQKKFQEAGLEKLKKIRRKVIAEV